MSRDTKRQLSWYQVDDTQAVARHLERMAAKGWLLEGIDNWFFRYRRAQPVQARYAVTFFPEASIYDARLTEGQETYIDYCRAAGWELAAAYGPIQYFRALRPDAVPIETDEAVKLTAIRRTMRKTTVLSYGLLLALPAIVLPMDLFQFRREPLEFLSSRASLSQALLMVGIALFSILILGDYLLWVLRSRRSVAGGGRCARPHTRFRLGLSAVMLALCAYTVWIHLTDPAIPGLQNYLLLYLALYGGIMLLSRALLRFLKRRGYKRANIRGGMIAFALAAGLAGALAIPALSIGLNGAGVLRLGREPAEVYRYTDPDGPTFTWDIYRDPLPITLEALGYSVAPEDHCTYEAEVSRSFLAAYSQYTQRPMGWGSELPSSMAYGVCRIRWPWLLERAWETLLAEEERPWWTELERLEPAPWGAEEAWQRESPATCFLRYPDRIVTMDLWSGVTPGQQEAIALTLAP